jgi:hypothetical protein
MLAMQLIKKNANVEAVNRDMETPLHLACTHGFLEIVNTLIEKDVEMNTKDIGGDTPIALAAVCGHTEVVDALIEADVEMNTLDSNGETTLYTLIDESDNEVMKSLIYGNACTNPNTNLSNHIIETAMQLFKDHKLLEKFTKKLLASEMECLEHVDKEALLQSSKDGDMDVYMEQLLPEQEEPESGVDSDNEEDLD